MAIAKRFGKNLRLARKVAGYTHEEVAIRASIHRTEVGMLERGERTPRIDTAIKLAGAIGVSLDELTEGITWTPGYARAGRFVAAGIEEVAGDDGKGGFLVTSTAKAK